MLAENNILTAVNNQFMILQKDYNESLAQCLDERHNYGETTEPTKSKFVKADCNVDILIEFTKRARWSVIMDVNTDGFITRLKAI